MSPLLHRRAHLESIREKLGQNPVVSILGPRQAGKTTLARQVAATKKSHYFDLEDPRSLARLEHPLTALEPLEGLVVIDEVQRRPDLFPLLRVLADRDPLPARFLILGSASPSIAKDPPDHGRSERVLLGNACRSGAGPLRLEAREARGLRVQVLRRTQDDEVHALCSRGPETRQASRGLPG